MCGITEGLRRSVTTSYTIKAVELAYSVLRSTRTKKPFIGCHLSISILNV